MTMEAEDMVGGVVLRRVWEGKLRENFVSITGEFAPKPLEDVVRGLAAHIERTVPEARRVHCDVCGGFSDADDDACPFCGDGRGPEPEPAHETWTLNEESSGGETEMARTKTAERVAAEAAAAEATKQSAVEVISPGNSPPPSTAIVSRGKLPTPTAPVIDLANAKPMVTEKDLDEEIQRFRDLHVDFVRSSATTFRRAGQSIERIHDRLWQQRLRAGKPKYKSWNQFVEQDLGITVSYAKKLRAAAKFTDEQIDQLGVTMLALIASAPPERHAHLLEAAPTLTRDEMQARVTQINEEIHEQATAKAEAEGKPKPKKKPGRPKKSQKTREEDTRAAVNAITDKAITEAKSQGIELATLNLVSEGRVTADFRGRAIIHGRNEGGFDLHIRGLRSGAEYTWVAVRKTEDEEDDSDDDTDGEAAQ